MGQPPPRSEAVQAPGLRTSSSKSVPARRLYPPTDVLESSASRSRRQFNRPRARFKPAAEHAGHAVLMALVRKWLPKLKAIGRSQTDRGQRTSGLVKRVTPARAVPTQCSMTHQIT